MTSPHKLITVQLELTSRCNERCVHCYIPHEWKTRNMDSALLMSLLDQCRDMGVEQVTFSGGEPMLHDNFWDILDKADFHGFKIRVFSNLTLLDDTKIMRLKTMRHIHEIQTSLYSVDPSIHDKVTQCPGSCEKTKRGFESLAEKGIPVFISCPLMKQNKDSYREVLSFAKRLGAGCSPNVAISAQSGGGTENLANRLSLDEALTVIQDILEHDTAYNAERFMPGYGNSDDTLPCVQSIGKASLCVNAHGKVLPSPAWNRVLGDLNNQTLRDIWENSAELAKIRAITLEKDFPQCRPCPDIQFCCMSLEENVNENPDGSPSNIPPHVCTLARRMRELVHGWHKKNSASREAG
ncbi:MAG: hypothetical protein Pg6C_03780 [Treponemataceae bacterium]|nr:MAG: hypothetical protein Pg6C_03780 [Treponemataceae bacterium]